MDIPLNNKQKRGAKKKTRTCLEHQPSDCIQSEDNVILESSEESEDEPDLAARSSKRHKPNDQSNTVSKICSSCKTLMKKRRGFFCPNGCTKKKN